MKIHTKEHEDSLLRSILLYRTVSKELGKDELKLIPIVAYVESSQGVSVGAILDYIRREYAKDLSEADLRQRLNQLRADGRLSSLDGEYYSSALGDTETGEFDQKLRRRDEQLINGVVERMKRSRNNYGLDTRGWTKVRTNARAALDVYFHQFGYAFVGLKNTPSGDQINLAVEAAREGLGEKVGDLLVVALYDLIAQPSEVEKDILEERARAYVTLEILQLDPTLRGFGYAKMGGKTFVVDTDVALHCLTTYACHSADFRFVAERLVQDAGAKMVIPRRVINEILNHIQAAKPRYSEIRNIIDQAPYELLENGNVFVEDYAKLRRSEPDSADLEFEQYMRRFSVSRGAALLENRLRAIFGQRLEIWEDESLVVLDDRQKEALKLHISQLTEASAKGATRTNSQNMLLAETDARIYLTVRRQNQNHPGGDYPFGSKFYLLTNSRKINKSVDRVLGVGEAAPSICNPAALMAIFREMGRGGERKVEYISLFDNPFLYHASKLMWPKIKPVLEMNTGMRHDDFDTLRYDFDTRLDEELTATTEEERLTKGHRLRDRGYSIGNKIIETQLKNDQLSRTLREKQQEIERLQRQVKNLQTDRSQADYKQRAARETLKPRRKKK